MFSINRNLVKESTEKQGQVFNLVICGKIMTNTRDSLNNKYIALAYRHEMLAIAKMIG